MDILIVGAGLMGRAIAFNLCEQSGFDTIAIMDKDKKTIQSAQKYLKEKEIKLYRLDVEKSNDIIFLFKKYDIAISAIPYEFNYNLAKIAIKTKTNFLDLGGNNDIVAKERNLFKKAQNNNIIIIPDCGLAPGLTSIITRDIVEQIGSIDYVKLRVGGLPLYPKPPLFYQITFSPHGLLNEYIEDALVLDHGKIIRKKSLTELEQIKFPEPFGCLEAFLTSGGCSTLPYTYKDKIGYLDYKTIRYQGHCKQFRTFLALGLGEKNITKVGEYSVVPRDFFIALLLKNLPMNEKDVVLLKVISRGVKDDLPCSLEYTMIEYYDENTDMSAMMRTTGYPVSIVAQMIERKIIENYGVFCPEEIVPCAPFFKILEKCNIHIQREIKFID